MSPDPIPVPAPLGRRLLAALYDAFLLLAVWMVAALLDALVRGALALAYHPYAFRAWLFLVGGLFFGWFWTHGGQTLGMRAWRLELRRADGGAPRWLDAAVRYAYAWAAWLPAGLGLWWCLVDRQRRSWHDIWSRTQVVLLPRPAAGD